MTQLTTHFTSSKLEEIKAHIAQIVKKASGLDDDYYSSIVAGKILDKFREADGYPNLAVYERQIREKNPDISFTLVIKRADNATIIETIHQIED